MSRRPIIFFRDLVARWRGGRKDAGRVDSLTLRLSKEVAALAQAESRLADEERKSLGLEILLKERDDTIGRLEANAREDDAFVADLEARCLSALDTADALEAELVRRQLGTNTDPDAVLVVTGFDEIKKPKGYRRLGARRREATRREQAEQTRRNAVRQTEPRLPEVPLPAADRARLRAALTRQQPAEERV